VEEEEMVEVEEMVEGVEMMATAAAVSSRRLDKSSTVSRATWRTD